MSFFQPPPATRYDLKFTLFDIPVQVHPLFWLIAVLFGWPRPLDGILVWVGVVFVSILVHEFGHALMMRYFGSNAYVVLYFGGGLAVPTGSRGHLFSSPSFTSNQQIIISLAGPFAGFILAALVLALVAVAGGLIEMRFLLGFIPLPATYLPIAGSLGNLIISDLLWVNIFWGLINLLPVLPLDGGRVAQHVLIKADPWDGMRKAYLLSTITGGIVAVAGLVWLQSIYIALLFGMLAFQSYQMAQGGGRFF